MTTIHGQTAPGFAAVREAFESTFADGYEHGGAVAVMLDGEPVVDLWGGHADAAKTRPWQRDTLVNVWSVTKGVVAMAVALLVQRGKLAYDMPVAQVWPEFAANGKGGITLGDLLSHQAGLNGFVTPMDEAGLAAWTPAVEALAAMAPLWPPRSHCIYHALTYGHLAGEVIRRADGRMPGRFVADEIAGPLGADFFIGLPEAQDHRVAEMIEGPGASGWIDAVLESPFPHSCRDPRPDALAPNRRAWRAAEIPGGNGQGHARGLAAIYGAAVQSAAPLLSPQTLQAATALRFRGRDESFDMPTVFAAGFRLEDEGFGQGVANRAFGHGGWGGSIAFGDPVRRLGFAYVTNRMLGFDDRLDPRRERLVNAVYAAL